MIGWKRWKEEVAGMTGVEILIVTAVFSVASFLNMVVGFGFGLIATPLMTILWGPKVAVLFVTAASFLLRVAMLPMSLKHMQVPVVVTAVAGVILGAFPGSYLLKIIDNSDLKIFLGLVLLGAAYLMIRSVRLPIQNVTLGRFLAGLGCGFFSACTTIGGPPLALWFINESMERHAMRSNLIWIFACSTGLTLVGSAYMGTIKVLSSPMDFLYTIPGLVIGYLVGGYCFEKINKQLFTWIVQGVVVFGAISSLVSGIMGKMG